MKLFASLVIHLIEAKSLTTKLAALTAYFAAACEIDCAWAVALLTGRVPGRVVPPSTLRDWASQASGIPPWLMERCYTACGDLSETLALMTVPNSASSLYDERPSETNYSPVGARSLSWWMDELLSHLQSLGYDEKQAAVIEAWRVTSVAERVVLNKLLSGTLRVRSGRTMVERSLSEVTGVPRAILSHRLDTDFQPTADGYRRLIGSDASVIGGSRDCAGIPYPFQPIMECPVSSFRDEDLRNWTAQYLTSGAERVQLVRQAQCTSIWSTEQENYAARFSEIMRIGDALADGTILEGEIADGICNAFATRHSDTVVNCHFLATDILKLAGKDLRALPLSERVIILGHEVKVLQKALHVCLIPALPLEHCVDLQAYLSECRAACADGILLKRKDSIYGSADASEGWRLVKAERHSITAVLLYAEAARGQAQSRFTNYTFGVWASPEGERQLIPIAKTADGLSNADRRAVDRFVLKNTLERHGPVRVVQPSLAVQIACEGVENSSRHKSGLTLRGVSAVQLLPETPAERADTLEHVRSLTRGTLAAPTKAAHA